MRDMRIGMMVLALVAVCAMSAVASATASAASMPLIVNGKGEAPIKKGFTSTSGASAFEAGGEKLSCKADTNKGTLTGPSTDEAEIKFTGCTAGDGLDKCKTSGAAAGEIILKVASELVWLDKTEDTLPGEDLKLPGTLTIECTGLAAETLKVKGSTLCQITPFKTLGTTGTITCKQSKGKQEFSKYYLGGTETTAITETEGTGFKKFVFVASGLESTDSLTYEESVEIM